jgi:hypothetical protein
MEVWISKAEILAMGLLCLLHIPPDDASQDGISPRLKPTKLHHLPNLYDAGWGRARL